MTGRIQREREGKGCLADRRSGSHHDELPCTEAGQHLVQGREARVNDGGVEGDFIEVTDLVHSVGEKRRDMAVGPHVAALGHLRDRVFDLRDERLHIGRGLVGLRLDLVHGHDECPAPRGIDEAVICRLPG